VRVTTAGVVATGVVVACGGGDAGAWIEVANDVAEVGDDVDLVVTQASAGHKVTFAVGYSTEWVRMVGRGCEEAECSGVGWS